MASAVTPAEQPAQADLPLDGGLPPASTAQALSRRAVASDPGVYDELHDACGRLRPAWDRLASSMPQAHAGLDGAATLDRRRQQVAERIRLDGVTHNVFGESGVAARPWPLGLLPLLVEAADWARIERGVVQRAALLEQLLADVYGARHVLREGLLPPALVFRHPGYLRPLDGVSPPGGQRLFIVAFDLARAADGQWWVMSQRTQVPSGLGYVMHNRLVISRQFPEAFQDLRVQHLASGFRRMLDTLEARARDLAGGAPRIVLLTPGPYSETFFEHAYLARYLGLPLVEGGDLTVLGESLYLKTVEGLQPVHGVLRRLDDDFCDPLELRPDSALGIPGLLQVARAGRVVLANALGSAFLESPAILGFLPAIARRLIGQELELPAVPTWWCGEQAAWADVRGRLDGKLLRSTFPRGSRTSQVHPWSETRVEDDPDAWTVQAHLRLSRAPIWEDGAVQSRPALVRVYAMADARGRWHALPGGMTRVAAREDASLSMQRGGTSLDTWVLTDGVVDTFSMLPQRLSAADISQRRPAISSRTGENLFWMGRYTERTEQLVRLARVVLQVSGMDHDAGAAALRALTATAMDAGLVPPGTPELAQSRPLFQRAMVVAMTDAEQAFSIAFNLQALERTALALRERMPAEHATLVRQMRESFAGGFDRAGGRIPGGSSVLAALDGLALQLLAATGAQTDRMTRDHGWRLLTVGRLLERLIGLTARMERFAASGALADAGGVELLLELFDSAITFRSRYQRHDDLLAVAELLVLDTAEPRALAGVLRRLRTELSKLPGDADWQARMLGWLPRDGAGFDLAAVAGDDAVLTAALQARCASLQAAALSLADEIGHRYFTLPGSTDQAQRV